MPLQSNTDPSASRAQKASTAKAANGGVGRASSGACGRPGSSISPRAATAPASPPAPAVTARLTSGSSPAAAASPAVAAPASAPKEKAACSEVNSRRPAARSTATPWAFMAMSSAPLAAPTANRRRPRLAASTASAGNTTVNGAATASTRSSAPDPRRATTAPVAGWASSSPSGAPSSASPRAPGPTPRSSWMAGSRAYQALNVAPLMKKTAVTAARARVRAPRSRGLLDAHGDVVLGGGGDQGGLQPALDGLLGHHALLDVAPRRQLELHLEQGLLDDRPQAARAGLALERLVGHRRECLLGEDELDRVEGEEPLELLDQGVARLGEDGDEVVARELVHGAHDRQAADELGDEAVLDEVLGQAALEDLARVALDLGLDRRAEAHALVAHPPLDDLVEVGERPAAHEQHVGRVDGQELLVGMLAAALRRHGGRGPLEDLQQRLLDPLARHVARDRRVVGLAGDLVDLVDVDDPRLGLLDVVVGRLDELEEDVLDVLADVAGLGQRRRVGDREGDVEDARERLGQQRLAAAGGPEQQDVGLLQLDVRVVGLHHLDALVVVVDRDRERALGLLLPDDVLVEDVVDLPRLGQVLDVEARRGGQLLIDDLVAEVDALVADVHAGAGDQLLDLPLRLAAEGAEELFVGVGRPCHLSPLRFQRLVLGDDPVDDAVVLGLVRAHEVVALGVLLDFLDVLAGVLGDDLVKPAPHVDDLARVDLDVGGLPLEARGHLVDQDLRVGQRHALALRPARQQQGAHRHRDADADGLHVGLDELHRVVDRESRVHRPAGRVDVQRDVLVRVLGLEVQHLGDDQVGDLVVDRRAEEDDAFVEQPGVDVERALAARRLLNDHRNKGAHGPRFSFAWCARFLPAAVARV